MCVIAGLDPQFPEKGIPRLTRDDKIEKIHK